MNILNLNFTDYTTLQKSIKEHFADDLKSVLIQFFDARNDIDLFSQMAQQLTSMLPNAVVLGVSTTDGIMDGKIIENGVVISICSFSKTNLIPLYTPSCNYSGGKSIASTINYNCKAALFFSEGFTGIPESFLNGVNETRKELVVVGGVASKHEKSPTTLISLNETVYTKGVVGVAFDNPSLHIFKDWKLNWHPIGKSMVVTKAEGPVVYELDNKPILEVIRHYFGDDAIKELPDSTASFPLIKTENHVHIARGAIAVQDDGGLAFAGNLSVGEKVRFGLVDIHSVINSANLTPSEIPEVIWIYSCIGRKAILGNLLEDEFSNIQSSCTNTGFFSHGEFFKTDKSVQMLNLTTTVFGLSEELSPIEPIAKKNKPVDAQHKGIATISRLANVVAQELEQAIKTLDSYKMAFDFSSIVSQTDKNGIILHVNEQFIKTSGYSKEELLGKTHYKIRHHDISPKVTKELWKTIKSGKVWKGLLKMQTKYGKTVYLESTVVPMFDENDEINGYITINNDITKIISQQEQIQRQTTDELTKLPNRIKLFEDIENSKNPILAIINVDNFSKINHFYGFASGNELLIELAKELKTIFSPILAQVYRLSADNFAVLVDEYNIESFYEFIEATINKLHSHYFLAQSQKTTVRISSGLSSGKAQLLIRAEEALRQARLRNVFWLPYDEKQENRQKENFEMLNTLNKAIEQKKIVPYYQPIVDLKTSRIEKYEALMRLIDEDGVVHTPIEFLDIAKKSKHYQELTKIMVETALHDFRNKRESISINISVEDVVNKDTVKFLEDAVLDFPNPSRIVLELTEIEVITDYYEVIEFMEKLKMHGVKISIDEFGSGYSNFAYIVQFKANFLKIDGSLISKIATDTASYRIVMAINNFAKSIGMKTVAEFVSDEKINDLVEGLDIDFAQGYYYSVPLPFSELP